MRMVFAALPLLALAACGGSTAPESAGSVAPPTGSAPSGGTGGGVTGSGNSPGADPSNFLAVSTATTFDAVGAMHSLSENLSTGAQLYQGNASTVRSPSGTISYDPRDGVFTLTLSDQKAGISRNYRFQDPAHRIDFDPVTMAFLNAPDLDGFNYLWVADDPTIATFFYQRPGTSTNYVSLAGFVRNEVQSETSLAERGVFVFGQPTVRSQIPISGSGTYTGGFIASMVASRGNTSDVLQWLLGSSSLKVDFAKASVEMVLTGITAQAYSGSTLIGNDALTVPNGATFNATGTATIDLTRTGGFSGEFQSANFSWGSGRMDVDFQRVSADSSTAGASSIDGAFYGPNAVNLGGSFRIIGGIPGERVDINGAFTGARK